MKILIVEDEIGILNSLTAYFAKSGYVCEVASTFREAEEKIEIYQYDCVILDITLPDGNGLDLLTQLKAARSKAGVLILSAKDSLDDRVKGLTLGADDYLPKPFHLTELNARLTSILRRLKFEGSTEVTVGNMHLDLEKRTVLVNGTPIVLKNKEYELLQFFISNQQRIVSKSSLAEHIWGDHIDQADSFDFLYSQIKNLRKKLTESQADHTIQALYGLGYKFVKE
jgi:DNA-binding response OmpR family regulator